MTDSVLAGLLGVETVGNPDALRALDALVVEAVAEVDALHSDPARRERIAAILWWAGFSVPEPDLEAREWLRESGLACPDDPALHVRVRRLRFANTPEAFAGPPPRETPINNFPDESGRRPVRAWSSR